MTKSLAQRFDLAKAAVEDLSLEALARLETAGEGTVVLADVSGSMLDRAGHAHNSKSRYEALCDALQPFREHARLICFDDRTVVVAPTEALPRPSGSTDVAGAITHAARFCPARTVLICDGEPDNEAQAYEAAESLPGVLDTIFIGDNSKMRAKIFMQELARRCGGTYHDLANAENSQAELGEALSTLLLTE